MTRRFPRQSRLLTGRTGQAPASMAGRPGPGYQRWCPQERQVGAETAGFPDHRDRLDLLIDLPFVELDELVKLPVPDQVVGELVGGGKPGENPRGDLIQVLARQVDELGTIAVAGPVQIAHVEPEVVDEGLALMLAEQFRRAALLAQKAAMSEQRGDPVPRSPMFVRDWVIG